MWFETLTGFREESPQQVRDNIFVEGPVMVSRVNGRRMTCGHLETPSLGELRDRVRRLGTDRGDLSLTEVVANVESLHRLPENRDAVFQVASQFNLLEMVSPGVTPEDGIDIYEEDFTQGPTCAIACGAGTIYRNYFAPVNGQLGQSATNQIDCLDELGAALGNRDQSLWQMQNGYLLPSERGLKMVRDRLSGLDPAEFDSLRQLLRIGVQWNTEITLGRQPIQVTQVYCSALPVRYCTYDAELWAGFGRLVLEAAYEATFCIAVLNHAQTGCNRLFLTLLGGGAFGNPESWIIAAIDRALGLFADCPLDVAIVSHGDTNRSAAQLVQAWQ